MRRCVACYESKPKKDLIRIVHSDNGITIDLSGKMNGRGAYLCNNAICFEKMIKSNKLSREFETDVSAGTYEALKEQFDSINKTDGSINGGGAIG